MKELISMIKITEFWLNIIIATFILMLLSYLISQGWKSTQFTNILFVILGFIIVSILVVLIPRKPIEKEIILKEKYTFSDSLLLMCVHFSKTTRGVELKNIFHNSDFINRSYLSLQELKTATQNMLSINMIKFDKKKYYLTDKFYHYFNESFIIDNNPFNQVKTIHALLNSLSFEKNPTENIEIDFYNQEEYDSSLEEYIDQMKRSFIEMKTPLKK
jgi:hypothetical protein